MVNVVKNYKLFSVLLIFWILFTFNFSYSNLIAGVIVCFVVTRLSYGILYNEEGFVFKMIKLKVVIKYFFNLIVEIYKSSFSYMARILKKDCEPCIVEVELSVRDPLIVTIISNSITLTPGTLTIDAKDNKLTVLALKTCKDCEESINADIKENFETFFINK